MKNLLLLMITVFLTSSIFYSQNKIFEAYLNYNPNKLDSELTAEILALNRAKMDLAFQISNYIDTTDLIRDHLALNSREIKTFIPCVVDFKIIEKTWVKEEYYLKLKSEIDNTLFVTRLNKSFRIKEEVNRIVKLRNRANEANLQLETLKRATFTKISQNIKSQFLIEYVENINVLNEEELFQKGYLSHLSMEYDTSITYYKKMTILNPVNELGYYFLALNYTALDDDDSAINYYKKALKISPSFAEANYNLGVLYAKKGNEYNANRYLQKASRLNHKKAKKLLKPK